MYRLPPFTACLVCGLWCAAALLEAGCTGPARVTAAAPQWAPDSSSVRMAAGPQYARGAVWRFFFGKHYRDVWALPVTVPVLRLATALPGGLMPMQAGGSFQSHTLRLCAPSGREFVLRSVDKDASAALPAGWKRQALGALMKDQTCAAQPYGAYVVARLAEAAGVLHTNPRLVYVPSDSALGRFRASHGKALYLLEERPDGNQKGQASFGNSPRVVSTAHMLADIRKRTTAQVVARAYLRARLLDMWIGDWSRREDQWRWASFPQPGGVTFRPIPRDRDQAFFLFDDGLITRLVSWFVPKYHSFRPQIRPSGVNGLTTTARTLDRTLLGSLSAEDFRQEADSLRHRLTDAVIAQALTASPAEAQPLIAAKFEPVLRARREQLPTVAHHFYKILAAESWLVGTDEAERFELSAAGPGRLRVRMFAQRPGQPDSLITERQYDRHDTSQLSVYGLAGNDVFEIKAPLKPGMAVHIYDGAGRDHLLNHAATAADLGGITWHSSSDGNTSANNKGVSIKPDLEAALTANYLGWLRRYNLND